MYFVVLFLLSGVIMFSVLRISTDKMVSLEIRNTQNSMKQAADLLEKQYQTLESIAVQIGSRTSYRLTDAASDPLDDIELLKDFKQYVNDSLLARQYFLVYSTINKIYTSTGNTSYFNYYAPATIGASCELAGDILHRITEAGSAYFERSGSSILMVFPLRIYTSNDSRSAALCFVLTEDQVQGCLEQMAVGMPEQYNISMDNQLFFSTGSSGDADAEALRHDTEYLEVVSARGRFTFGAVPSLACWIAQGTATIISTPPSWLMKAS